MGDGDEIGLGIILAPQVAERHRQGASVGDCGQLGLETLDRVGWRTVKRYAHGPATDTPETQAGCVRRGRIRPVDLFRLHDRSPMYPSDYPMGEKPLAQE